ncbi:MAG: hypothetical protein ACYTEX_27685 [Planctomycetota bacterium]|jgi:hypothetical protein
MSINRLKVTKTLDATGATCLNVSADYLRHILIENFGTTETGVTGAQQVTNGNFSADTDWTKGTGWTIASNKATKTAGTASTLEQANADIEVGESYYVTVRLSGVTAGSVTPYVGNTGTGTARSANGFYGETIVAAGTLVQGISADASFAGSCEVVSIRPLETVALTDKMLRAVTRENQILQSENLNTSPWARTRLTVDEATGIDGPRGDLNGFVGDDDGGTPTSHLITQAITLPSTGRFGIRAALKSGTESFLRVKNLTSVKTAHVNIEGKAIENSSSGVVALFVECESGCTDVLIEMDGVAGANTIELAPCTSSYSLAVDADGIETQLYVGGVHIYQGSILENIGYAKTTTASFPRQLTVEITVDRIAKEESGLRQRADAISPHDGWEYPVPGTQYRLANGNFWEVFEGSMSGSESTTLTPVQSGSSTLKPFAIHSKGNVTQDAGSDGKGTSYTVPFGGGAADYTGLRSTPGTTSTSGIFELYAGTTPRQVGYKYRAEIEYNYEYSAIPPA